MECCFISIVLVVTAERLLNVVHAVQSYVLLVAAERLMPCNFFQRAITRIYSEENTDDHGGNQQRHREVANDLGYLRSQGTPE